MQYKPLLKSYQLVSTPSEENLSNLPTYNDDDVEYNQKGVVSKKSGCCLTLLLIVFVRSAFNNLLQ